MERKMSLALEEPDLGQAKVGKFKDILIVRTQQPGWEYVR
jgi:hypothetical protein